LEDENRMERICTENIAIPYFDNAIYDNNFACDLYQIDEPIGYAWAVAHLYPNNPLRGIFNY
ncbi:hypothetical protein ABTN09_21230, partial [Acinetobacter baumannii]